ncbi:hypothetical protein [Floridanema evergladense]|uniref:Uncharacterized protein n=1 Tax=Floridaenema evergladense BLCC-F167 TaxID=3153639 RepID=A0ABV4WGP8_9CYAN
MNLKKFPKSRTITTFVVSLTLCGLASIPASAVPINPLSDLLGQIQRYFNQAENYISQALAEKIKPLEEAVNKDFQTAINSAIGVLGIPDPIATRKSVEETLSDSDVAVNPLERTTNEVDRQITRSTAAATLGTEGQQRTQQEITATKQSVDLVQQQAQQAQEEVVTQNVMKRIAQQNTQISAMLGALRNDSLQSAQRQELANINLTNISRSLDSQNQAKSNEMVGAGLETLKITSRAKLF